MAIVGSLSEPILDGEIPSNVFVFVLAGHVVICDHSFTGTTDVVLYIY